MIIKFYSDGTAIKTHKKETSTAGTQEEEKDCSELSPKRVVFGREIESIRGEDG